MTATAFMDGVLALLLCATCVYCVMLNRRLRTLKKGQDDLQAAISVFDKAAASINLTLERLEASGIDQSRDLDRSLDKASAMAAELSVMVSAGDNIAGRLERAVGDVRAIGAKGVQKANQSNARPYGDESPSLEKCA